ncbi:hypothetical protein ACO2Q1_01110 [Brevundimonas sp. VNH65]
MKFSKSMVLAALLLLSAVGSSTVEAQDQQQSLCPNGEPQVWLCTYRRDAQGNIVLDRCEWACP